MGGEKRTREDATTGGGGDGDDGMAGYPAQSGVCRMMTRLPPRPAHPVTFNTMAHAYASAATRAMNAGTEHPDVLRQAISFRGCE